MMIHQDAKKKNAALHNLEFRIQSFYVPITTLFKQSNSTTNPRKRIDPPSKTKPNNHGDLLTRRNCINIHKYNKTKQEKKNKNKEEGDVRSSERKSKSMTMEEARVMTPPESVRLQKSSLILGQASKFRSLLIIFSIFGLPSLPNLLSLSQRSDFSSRFITLIPHLMSLKPKLNHFLKFDRIET